MRYVKSLYQTEGNKAEFCNPTLTSGYEPCILSVRLIIARPTNYVIKTKVFYLLIQQQKFINWPMLPIRDRLYLLDEPSSVMFKSKLYFARVEFIQAKGVGFSF